MAEYKLRIQTMREDLAKVRGQKPAKESKVIFSTAEKKTTNKEKRVKTVKKPVSRAQIIKKVKIPTKERKEVVAKPITKERIVEKIVKVVDEKKMSEMSSTYQEEINRLKASYEAKLREKPKVVEKIIEKPVIQERIVEKIIEKPVIKIQEKIVKVVDEKKMSEMRSMYQEEINRLKASYEAKLREKPTIRIIEKPVIHDRIIERPIIREIGGGSKVIESKKSPQEKDRKRKQLILGIGFIVFLIALGIMIYFLLKAPGDKIVIKPKPPKIEEKEEIIVIEEEIPDIIEEEIPDIEPERPPVVINIPDSFRLNDQEIVSLPNNRLALIIDAPSSLETISALTTWEATMPLDLADLFTKKKSPKAKFKTNSFEFPGVIIRLQDTKNLEESIHYAFNQGKILVTTGETDMRILVNSLWITP